MPAPNARWQATDLGDVTTRGAEFEITWHPLVPLEMTAFYQFLDKNTARGQIHASRYVLDYPEHYTGFRASWLPAEWCQLQTVQAWIRQTPNAVRTSDRDGFESSLAVTFLPPAAPNATVTVWIENLMDDNFQIHPGQRPAERRVGTTIGLTW